MPNKRYNKQILKMADGGSISPKDIEKMTEKAKPAADRAFNILREFREFRDKKKKPKSIKENRENRAPKKKDKPKPVIKSVKKKTDEQKIAEHIALNGVTTERKGKAKYYDGVKWCDYDNDIIGKKEIGSKVKQPLNDLTYNVLIHFLNQDWLSCRQITEAQFGKENFDNTLDKEVRIEIYKLEDRKFIDKKIEGTNRHFYKLNKLGYNHLVKKSGGR